MGIFSRLFKSRHHESNGANSTGATPSVPLRDGEARPSRAGSADAADQAYLDLAFGIVKEAQESLRRLDSLAFSIKELEAEQLRSSSTLAEASAETDDGVETHSQKPQPPAGCQMDQLLRSFSNEAKHVKRQLDKLSEVEVQVKDDPSQNATFRIIANQRLHFIRRLSDALAAREADRQVYRAHKVERIARLIRIRETKVDAQTGAVSCAVTEEESVRMAQLALSEGLQDEVLASSKELLLQVVETRNDMMAMEHSVRQLKTIFDDLTLLISQQEEVLDQVLTNVRQSQQYVERGRETLHEARMLCK
jgi:t-SNARE complex subunit (syntaxin)